MMIRGRWPGRWVGVTGILSLTVLITTAACPLLAQSDPGSSFLEYRSELDEATSIDAIRVHLLSGVQKMLGYATERELVSWFETYKQKRLQSGIEILSEESSDDGVRLRARGTDSVDGRPLLGRVDMRLEDGSWRVAEEIWYPDFRVAASPEEAVADHADGVFSVDGNEVEMRHAYAELRSYWADNDLPALRLTISDQPIDPNDFDLRQRSDAGELYYFVLTISSEQMVNGGMMYHQAYDGGYVSLAGVHNLETTRFGPTVIEGRVSTDKPVEFTAVTEYSVEFRATILSEE